MNEEEICVGCLKSGKTLYKEYTPWMNACENLLCSFCRAFVRKMNSFNKRCLKTEEYFKVYLSENRGSYQNFKEFVAYHKNVNEESKPLEMLSASNMLCIDITHSLQSDQYISRAVSYCHGDGTSTNYADGMVNIRLEDESENVFWRKKWKNVKKDESNVKMHKWPDSPSLDDSDGGQGLVEGSKEDTSCEGPPPGEGAVRGGGVVTSLESMFVCRTSLTHSEQLQEMENRKFSQEYLTSPHKCTSCYLGFKFLYSLDNHMKKHSEESGPEVCGVCTQRFSTNNKLKEHVRSHHSQVIQCLVCGRKIKEKKRLREHWESHLGITHTCDTCKRGFKTKSALIHHMAIHNNQFHCPKCAMVLRSRATFKKHLLLHSSVRPHGCASCPRTFATREWLELHTLRAHAPTTEQHYCVECDYRFKSNREYKKHLTAKKHTDPSLLIHWCAKCTRRYASQEELARHIAALHDRVLSHSCGECSAKFATVRGLYGHRRRVHMGYVAPKKYKCSYCGKAFRDKYYLSNHVKIHRGDSAHECTLCHSTFTHASTLADHISHTHAAT